MLTLHRPANVDGGRILARLLAALNHLSQLLPIVFPVHPRARQTIETLAQSRERPGLRIIQPLDYLDFLRLMSQSKMVLTDSGRIQEETSYLGLPCLTLRANTERPITLEMGTNALVGQDVQLLEARFRAILDGDRSWDRRPPEGIPLWDGHAAERIAEAVLHYRTSLRPQRAADTPGEHTDEPSSQPI